MESVQTNDKNIHNHWVVFDNLVKHLAKVIAMDADTGYCTYEILVSSRKRVHMIINLWRPSPEEAPIDMYYDKSETFFAAVVAAAKQAKTAPFVIVSTSRTQAEVIHKHCLEACPNAVIKKYNLDFSAADHKDFNDVNTAWANVDILIYTLTVTAGCSFEVKHFTQVFVYFSSLSTDYKTANQMLGWVRNVSTREYHIFINSRSNDLPIHKEEVEKSITNKFRAMSSFHDPLVSRLFSVNGKLEFGNRDLFHQTHVNNIVHLNCSRCFFNTLFKQARRQMNVVVREPTQIEVPKDLKHTIAKDQKEVSVNVTPIWLGPMILTWTVTQSYPPNPSLSWRRSLSSQKI